MAVHTTKQATATAPIPATNGTVQFWDGSNAIAAAQQACADVNQFKALVTTGSSGDGHPPEVGPALIAAGVSAAAGVASALIAGGSFGLGVASSVKSGSTSTQVQLTIANYSSSPVVAYNCNPTYLDITDMPNPLASGSSDVLVLTSSSSFNTHANFQVEFMVGVGAMSIPFQWQYAFSSASSRWVFSAAAGGSPEHSFQQNLQLYGLSFKGNTGYPSFSAYSSNIETGGGGVLSLAVYDYVPQS